MHRSTTIPVTIALAALAAACSESAGPSPAASRPDAPRFAALGPTAPSTGISLGQVNGTLGETGRILVKGFNPTNPHHGDAIVATFFWRGPATIDSVVDVLTNLTFTRVGNTYTRVAQTTAGVYSMATTRVGNTYTRVDQTTAGGYSMATYVAIN